MSYKVTHLSRLLRYLALGCTLGFISACSAHTAHASDVEATFLWGPVKGDIISGVAEPTPAFDQASHAARLREELLAPVNRYAPTDKDWRVVRGTDKGPTIIGARFSFGLGDQGHNQLRLGAVRRGANRTYGPQLIFNFKD